METTAINVIGMGYIGLPTALMLAAHGNQVVGTDYKPEVVNRLRNGEVTFEEAGLKELYQKAVAGGMRFSDEYQKAEVYIIAVPTPYDKKSKKVDAGYVIRAVVSVLEVCDKGAVLVIESTVSPGTIDRYIRPQIESMGYQEGTDIHLVHAPERIIPGNMLYELVHNSRTIGADDIEIAKKIQKSLMILQAGQGMGLGL